MVVLGAVAVVTVVGQLELAWMRGRRAGGAGAPARRAHEMALRCVRIRRENPHTRIGIRQSLLTGQP